MDGLGEAIGNLVRGLLLAAGVLFAAVVFLGVALVTGGCASTNPDTAKDVGGAAGAAVSGILRHTPVVGSVLESADAQRARVGEWRAERREAREAERVRGMQWELCVAHPEAYGAICRERFAEFRDFAAPERTVPKDPNGAGDVLWSPPPSPEFMARVRAHEGFRPVPGPDASGKLHVGYGHNIDANSVLARDLAKGMAVAEGVVGPGAWGRLNQTRREVLGEMALTLGSRGLSGFGAMLDALRGSEWTLAAYEMINSLWAAQQGGRSIFLAEMMRTGRGG
ncbi:MAG: hypothetical protein F4Y03_10115 [Alphaproteobacteria bacterium]|nr:hypothetical protein [Alphaproteobacteria bacterium]